jgi:hypothetical protein
MVLPIIAFTLRIIENALGVAPETLWFEGGWALGHGNEDPLLS